MESKDSGTPPLHMALIDVRQEYTGVSINEHLWLFDKLLCKFVLCIQSAQMQSLCLAITTTSPQLQLADC